MITLDNKPLVKKYRKLSNKTYNKKFALRLKIYEVEILLRKPEHIQAKRGFVSMVKLLGKRNEVIDIFNHLPKRR